MQQTSLVINAVLLWLACGWVSQLVFGFAIRLENVQLGHNQVRNGLAYLTMKRQLVLLIGGVFTLLSALVYAAITLYLTLYKPFEIVEIEITVTHEPIA